MVTWFQGYALPEEIAERAWRDLRRAIVCGSLEVVAVPLTGVERRTGGVEMGLGVLAPAQQLHVAPDRGHGRPASHGVNVLHDHPVEGAGHALGRQPLQRFPRLRLRVVP